MSAVLNSSGLKITKIKEHVGAEATGIDLRKPVDATTLKRLTDAIAEHAVLVVRDRKSTRLNSSHSQQSRMPSSA